MHRRMVRDMHLLSFQHTYVRRMAAAPTTEKEQDKKVRVGTYAGNSTRVDPLLAFIGQDPLFHTVLVAGSFKSSNVAKCLFV